VGRLQLINDVLENTRKELGEISERMKSMYSNALITHSKIVALILATPYSTRFRGGSQKFEEVGDVGEIPQYVSSVANTLRESCSTLKNLVLNAYIAVSEHLPPPPVELNNIEKIDCATSKSLLDDLRLMLESYDNIINTTLPKLRELHSKYIEIKGLVGDKLRKLKEKNLEGFESPAILEELYGELDEVSGIISELEVLSYLRRYSSIYNNLLVILDKLINTLNSDLGKVSLKIRAIYGENAEIEDLLLGRMKRNVDLIKSKASKDGIRSPANLVEGLGNLLLELPTILENAVVVLERLVILNHLFRHLALFSDYVMQELTEKKSINVNELPFTTDVSVQLIWVLLVSRGDIEVYEGVVRLKEGGG
jgi:hypothetical protein